MTFAHGDEAGAGGALPIDESLFFKLARVVNLTARPFTAGIGRAHGLALNEWRVMLVLASHPGVAATEVASISGLDKMSVSRALAALDRHGRLRKERDRADARRTHVWLSATGLKLMQRMAPMAKEREDELLAGLSSADRAHLAALLDRLALQLLRADEQVSRGAKTQTD
jgi:DNA-binding MarR family transcriptional regulator